MSDSATKQRPTIDLDEFERRLRQTAPMRDDDPLAELARLVGEQPDPYGDVFARHPVSDDRAYDARQEPSQQPMSRRLSGDFAAIEAGLRGAITPHAPDQHGHDLQHGRDAEAGHDAYAHQAPHDASTGYAPQGGFGGEEDWTAQAGYEHPAYAQGQQQRASRKPLYVIAASIAVGVIGIGAAFALKSHVGTSAREVKTIMADAGPTKIQPAPDAAADHPQQDSSMAGGTSPVQPTKLVSREEQPVELSQAVQENAARDPLPSGSDAASVAVPPPPDQAAAGATVQQTQGFAADVAPKHVKVVSVRPDGTPIVDDQPPEAAMPAPRQAPAKTSDKAGPVAKSSTPKSTSRIATTPKSIAALAGDATGDTEAATAPKPAKAARKMKPQHVAIAEPTPDATDAAPIAAAPDAADAKPVATSGGFAVQLAAPGSEAEAKAASAKLGKKFASALGGHHLGFHKAESNGRSVYRVRVSSLSREDAVGLCEKLKADGGQCFVAKN